MSAPDLCEIEPGVYYLIERQNADHWAVLICRNIDHRKTQICGITCATDQADARTQAFADIEEALWDRHA